MGLGHGGKARTQSGLEGSGRDASQTGLNSKLQSRLCSCTRTLTQAKLAPHCLFFFFLMKQENFGQTGSESDFSRRSCAKSGHSRGLHLHGEPFTRGRHQVTFHLSLLPTRASFWRQRMHIFSVTLCPSVVLLRNLALCW